MAKGKRITCFFISKNESKSFTIDVDTSSPSGETEAIQNLIEKEKLNAYSLSFVIDNDNTTYQAEYLHSINDFQARQHLIPSDLHMKTVVRNIENNFTPNLEKRCLVRNMAEHEWIERHASGTLRKNKRIGFTYRTQYLAERVAYEFGYGFEILPRSQVTFGDPISEENCHAITEAGWHIERYMSMDIFGDYFEAKYIQASLRDNTSKQGIGIIIRETSAPWIPDGHIVFSIVTEFDPIRKEWKNATNPF